MQRIACLARKHVDAVIVDLSLHCLISSNSRLFIASSLIPMPENEYEIIDLIARCEGEYRLACPYLLGAAKPPSCEVAERRTTRGLLRVENRACSAPRLLLCLGQRDELLHVTWHRVEPTAGPLLLRLLNALWPG